MNTWRWLSSPLVGTAAVIAGLCLIAVPLRKLTSAQPSAPTVRAVIGSEETAAVLRLKLLAPAERVIVRRTDSHIILQLSQAIAGESEHDVMLELADEGVDLDLTIEGSRAQGETAAFLTVMPDGREELTRYTIGEGDFGEILHYEWPHNH